jgi:uncharacterized membrane protein
MTAGQILPVTLEKSRGALARNKALLGLQTPAMTSQNAISATSDTPSGGICYIFGVLFPLFYLLSVPRERQHPFLRFHCFQCLFLFVLLAPLLWFVRSGPLSYLSLILVVGWLVAMIQARRRKMFHLPLLGYLAERLT